MKALTNHKWLWIFLFMSFSVSSSVYAYQWGEFDWRPTFNLDETYDTNVTYASENKHSDFITSIAPGIEGIHEGKTNYAKFKGMIHQKIYSDDSEFNNLSEDFSAFFKQEITKYDRFTVSNSFLHADQPSTFDDEFGRQSGLYDFYKNLFGLSYSHDFTSQLTTGVKYDNEYYNPNREDLSKSVQHTFGLQTDYAISSQTIPFLFYDYSTRSYDPGSTISRNSTGVGAKHYLTEQLYLNGKVGADFINPVGEHIVRPQYMVGITNEPDATTVYGATFTRHYEDSSYDQNLLNSWRFSLNWGKQLMARLQGIVTAFTGGGKFEPNGAKERLDGIGLGVNYETTPDSTLGVALTLAKKNSSDDTREYEKNTVSLNYKIKF